jgi:hypothetical protein
MSGISSGPESCHLRVLLCDKPGAQVNSTVNTITCSDCGLRTKPGEPDCAALRDALLARDFEQPAVYWKYHRMALDAYCVQHSAFVESAKSLAAHLCGLCIALEYNNDPATLRGIQQWLSTNPNLQKPDLPAFRGRVTIADVSGIEDPVEYGRAVEAWARSAWEAWRDLQPLARQWIAQSAVQSIIRGTRR